MSTNINFPDNPSLDQEYTYGTTLYKYNGEQWEIVVDNTCCTDNSEAIGSLHPIATSGEYSDLENPPDLSTVIKDEDFTTDGIMTRNAEGSYGVIIDSHTDWNTGYAHSQETHDYDFISGNDAATDVTGAELEELTDASETTLHSHAPQDLSVIESDISDLQTDLGDTQSNVSDLQDITVTGEEVQWGACYNRYAVDHASEIANTGWHVATNAEWDAIIALAGGTTICGEQLKDTGNYYWSVEAAGVTNSFGLTLRGGGGRINDNSSNEWDGWLTTLYVWTGTPNAAQSFSASSNHTINVANMTSHKGGYLWLVADTPGATEYIGNDGKIYPTTDINGVTWTARPLSETRYRDGSYIYGHDFFIPIADWIPLGRDGMAYYQGDSTYGGGQVYIDNAVTTTQDDITQLQTDLGTTQADVAAVESVVNTGSPVEYGALYNHYAVRDGREIAPTGWHVPTKAEIDTLDLFVGELSAPLRETGLVYWDSPNTGTNTTGWNGRGGGYRTNSGSFTGLKNTGDWWTATEATGTYWFLNFGHDSTGNSTANIGSVYGMSLRLIKDDSNDTGTMVGNDSKVYSTVTIGTQVWMSENLNETLYRDKSAISFHGLDNNINYTNAEWAALVTEGMCYYNNDEANGGGQTPLNNVVTNQTDEITQIQEDVAAIDYAAVSAVDDETDVTAAELEELTDGSETTLHSHAQLAPLAHNHTLSEVTDSGSIASLDYWTGTQAAYDLLDPWDSNTLYFIEE